MPINPFGDLASAYSAAGVSVRNAGGLAIPNINSPAGGLQSSARADQLRSLLASLSRPPTSAPPTSKPPLPVPRTGFSKLQYKRRFAINPPTPPTTPPAPIQHESDFIDSLSTGPTHW